MLPIQLLWQHSCITKQHNHFASHNRLPPLQHHTPTHSLHQTTPHSYTQTRLDKMGGLPTKPTGNLSKNKYEFKIFRLTLIMNIYP